MSFSDCVTSTLRLKIIRVRVIPQSKSPVQKIILSRQHISVWECASAWKLQGSVFYKPCKRVNDHAAWHNLSVQLLPVTGKNDYRCVKLLIKILLICYRCGFPLEKAYVTILSINLLFRIKRCALGIPTVDFQLRSNANMRIVIAFALVAAAVAWPELSGELLETHSVTRQVLSPKLQENN